MKNPAMRTKPRISFFLQRSVPCWGERKGRRSLGYPASDSYPLPQKGPIQARWDMLVGSDFVSPLAVSPQAWTRARWLMRASIGTPQTAASAVVAVGEPSWAAPSCHAGV